MQAVADHLGVHQTTVSLALRDNPRIPLETRKRIKAAAEKLGYRPNPYVSAFVASRRRKEVARQAVIGYVTADDPEHGGRSAVDDYPDLYEGAKKRAEELGYGLEHFWLGDPKLKKESFNRITETRAIHGLLLAPLRVQSPTLQVDWNRFSTVAYGYSVAEPRVHRVYPDFYHGMTMALQRCREAGYTRIGFMLYKNAERKADNLWLSAYLGEHYARGSKPLEPLIVDSWNGEDFTAWVQSERPQVVIGLLSIIRQVKVWLDAGRCAGQPPQLLTLNAVEKDLDLNLAGVFIDRREIGAVCINQLVSMLHRNERGVPEKPQHLLMESNWVQGDFTPA